MNRSKKISILIVASAVAVGILFTTIAPPYVSAWMTRRQFGNLDSFSEDISSRTNGFWLAGYYSGELAGELHVPSSDDLVFSSNEVYQVNDDLWIVGCYGVTDWLMWISFYSRTGETIDITAADENDIYRYKVSVDGANDSAYPEQNKVISALVPSVLGYKANNIFAAPVRIDDEEIIVRVVMTDSSEEKEIRISVRTYELIQQ